MSVLPGNPGSDWTPELERYLQRSAALPEDDDPTLAEWLNPKFAREILRLRAENEQLRFTPRSITEATFARADAIVAGSPSVRSPEVEEAGVAQDG